MNFLKSHRQIGLYSRVHVFLLAIGIAVVSASFFASAEGEADALRVDRESGMLTFQATATGLAGDEVIEFALVRTSSAKDYEALALSEVPPSELDQGLRALGMTPGRAGGMNDQGIPLWPKGERVLVSYTKGTASDDQSEDQWQPIESLILDTTTNKPLSPRGFVFIGSKMLPDPERQDDEEETEVYAADVYGPQAMISLYNEPRAILEIPLQARQGDVYGRFLPNPEANLKEGDTLTIRMRPEYPGERRRVLELDLHVNPAAEEGDGDFRRQKYRLLRAGEEEPLVEPTLPAVLNYFATARSEEGRDPFVSLHFDHALPVKTVVELCRLIDTLDVPRGIRVEPPPDKHIYYRAFAPNPAWRDRDERVTQPYELDLELQDGKARGTLRHLQTVWGNESGEHELKVTETSVTSPDELAAAVRKRKPGMDALFIEAPGRMRYGALLEFTAKAREIYPTVFVFTRP
ncbi:MAG: YdjY domain-containing protein [Verrucomicrobiota bacterium]